MTLTLKYLHKTKAKWVEVCTHHFHRKPFARLHIIFLLRVNVEGDMSYTLKCSGLISETVHREHSCHFFWDHMGCWRIKPIYQKPAKKKSEFFCTIYLFCPRPAIFTWLRMIYLPIVYEENKVKMGPQSGKC